MITLILVIVLAAVLRLFLPALLELLLFVAMTAIALLTAPLIAGIRALKGRTK